MDICQVVFLGRVPYQDAWQLQKQLAQARGADHIPDTLLLLEHPHTYTLGSAGHADNILLSADELAARGVDVHRVDRGGDVTYHGPGQLVGYPILRLPPALDNLHADVIAYIRALESCIITALAAYGIEGWPYPTLTGVWVGEKQTAPEKICAIGVKVTTRRVTMHGFALNVNTDLSYFGGIIPCGIRDKGVTSMQSRLGTIVEMEAVRGRVSRAFGLAFQREMVPIDHGDLRTGTVVPPASALPPTAAGPTTWAAAPSSTSATPEAAASSSSGDPASA